MDTTTERIAAYAASCTFDAITPRQLTATKQRFFDGIGCAIGAYDSEPARVARAVAATVRGLPPARLYVDGAETTPGMAGFVNTAMMRYLDFNDNPHGSDTIPVLVAAAEAHGCSGRDLIVAVNIAYEIMRSFDPQRFGVEGGEPMRETQLRGRGWDQGLHVVIAVAAAAAQMLGGDLESIAHAVALAAVPNVPVRQTRAGELSMWKGCATAASAQCGLFAAELALAGMTGPELPFEGRHGIFEQVTGPLEIAVPAAESPSAIESTRLKFYPTEAHSQAPLNMIERMRSEAAVDEIERIDVQTYWHAFSEIGSDPEKWRPSSRETADHSLPFLIAVMLVDGFVGIDTFTEARFRDPEILALMDKVSVSESEEFTARYPKDRTSKIDIATTSGRVLTDTVRYARGDARDPMSPAELSDKVRRLVLRVGPAEWADEIEATVDRLEELPLAAELVDALVLPKP